MTKDKDTLLAFPHSSGKGLKSTKLGAKFALMGAGSVLIMAIALVILAVWQSGQYNKLAQEEVDFLINADLDHITQGVYNLVRTENEAVQLQVNYNLNVARHILAGKGKASLSIDTIKWTATNQFTNEPTELILPKLIIGDEWLGQIKSLSIETPFVDEVTNLVGETATIFQRMNERGDMLRVATTVINSKGERAIGTYIPAVNPDGTNNPVISTILKNKSFHGRAYVVNDWYLTAYEPLQDSNGNLVGMVYVGVKQKVVEERVRNAILQTNVGRTGYVYVLGGKGEDRGRYIISSKGERDGEDIWSVMDDQGNYVIREIINKAIALKPEEMTTVRYRWQNLGEPKPRLKIARIAYYAPWDWVIGTSVYEDELQTYRILLNDGRFRMTRIMTIAALIISLFVTLIFIFLTWTITRPVRQMTEVAEKIIGGDLDQIVDVKSRDEIGLFAHTFNLMTGKLKASMESLRKSEEKYRGIYENALEGLFQNTIDGHPVSANPAMARILGYNSSDDLISGLTDVRNQTYVNPNDRDTIVNTILEKGEALGVEVQFYRKDKTKIWVSSSSRLVCDDSGNPAFIQGFITDISDRKHAEEEKKHLETRLIQSQKMEAIGTLAGGIAHDFNNILSAIIGYTELALDDIPPAHNARDELKEVLNAGLRAKELVKQILTFGRMTKTEYSPIALRAVVKECLKMLRSVIPSTIEIRQDLAASGLVMSDSTQISQIVMNLCTNAAHSMDKTGGILEVTLKETTIEKAPTSPDVEIAPGPYFILSIRDNGRGIPPEIMDRIFEPYFTTKELGQGTGLGLSVIHGIINSHNGAISCNSILNKGTTFDVYLPKITHEEVRDETEADTPIHYGNERILFVDDEEVIATLVSKMLTSKGYSVVSMTSSVEALELFREKPWEFDVIITDMTMPGMTGDRLAQEVIKIRHDIPVILCTGYNENISEKKAKEIGIREFIMKPLDMRTMCEYIRKLFKTTE